MLTAAAGVPDAAAEAAARAAGGAPRRLARGAVEVAMARPLPEDFALPGIDLNAVPAEGRRKRMLIADMDSTIIGVECIDELADFAGLKPQVAAITEAAMQRRARLRGGADRPRRAPEGPAGGACSRAATPSGCG